MAELSHPSVERRPLWIALLVVASVVFSLGFACAVPLAAFAAIAALTLSRRDAFALVGAVWLANQIAGFTLLHYPMDPSTFAWGAATWRHRACFDACRALGERAFSADQRRRRRGRFSCGFRGV